MNSALSGLQKFPIDHAWAIQDLTNWPETSKIHFTESAAGISYVLFSGHPASGRHPLILLSNQGGEIEPLLSHLPQTPFVVRETNANLLPFLKPRLPKAIFYLEQRMIVDKSSFQPQRNIAVRQVTQVDLSALAEFSGVPPAMADRLKGWIQGAFIMAHFEGDKIASMATTVVRTPGAWILAGIETKSEFRGRGFASAVTSAITEMALEKTQTVSLTVLKGNEPALKVYSKLGFQAREDQIWVDNQTGSKP